MLATKVRFSIKMWQTRKYKFFYSSLFYLPLTFHSLINRDLSNPCFIYRYDVELYQRIEQLIGKKLPLYPTVEEEVMLLMERVTEAQRYAKMVRIPPHLTPYIQVCLYVTCVCSWKNRFYVAALLFSNKTQMTSKLGRNKKVKHEAEPRSLFNREI